MAFGRTQFRRSTLVACLERNVCYMLLTTAGVPFVWVQNRAGAQTNTDEIGCENPTKKKYFMINVK